MNAELRGLAYWMRQRSDEEKRDGEEVEAAIYRECAGKLEAALSVAQGQGWLPIESAPRDGTPIIVTDGERCAAVYPAGTRVRWWPNVWMGTTHCGMKGPKFWQPAPPLPAAPAQPDGVGRG